MLNSKALLNSASRIPLAQAGNSEANVAAQSLTRVTVGAMSRTTSSESDFLEPEAELESQWNPANFDIVVNQYQLRIYRFIYSMVGEAEIAHDLTQDTFLSAYKNLCKRAEAQANGTDTTGTNNNMSAWLYTIARNTALSELRRRKIVRFFSFWQRPNEAGSEEQDTVADMPVIEPGGSLEARAALSDELQRAIDSVGRERLTALFLYLDGFSYKEICAITGSSLSSVKSQIFRAKESLRKALGDSPELSDAFGNGGNYD